MEPITPVLPSAPGPEDVLVWAKTQPQYKNLPSIVSGDDGLVTTRWLLTLRERIRLLIHGSLWLQILTFNSPLQPVKLLVDEPKLDVGQQPRPTWGAVVERILDEHNAVFAVDLFFGCIGGHACRFRGIDGLQVAMAESRDSMQDAVEICESLLRSRTDLPRRRGHE